MAGQGNGVGVSTGRISSRVAGRGPGLAIAPPVASAAAASGGRPGGSSRRSCRPSIPPTCAQAEDQHEQAAADHDGALDRVGVDHGGQPADAGVEAHDQGGRPDAGRRVPAEDRRHQLRRRDEHDPQVAGHEYRPAGGEHRPDAHVVAALQELGDGVDARAIEERHEHEGRHDHRRHAADPLEVRHRDPVRVRRAADADDVGAADVGGDERHADRPPRQPTPAEEEVGAGLHASADEHAQPDRDDQVDQDHRVVDRRESGGRVGHGSRSPGGGRIRGDEVRGRPLVTAPESDRPRAQRPSASSPASPNNSRLALPL